MDLVPSFNFKNAIVGVSHDKKWDIFKPELEVLFKSAKHYTEIAQHMKKKYDFDANIPAYKYRFEKWNWKKNVPKQTKQEILDCAQQRASFGKRTAAIFGSMPVDAKRLKRHVASTNRETLTTSRFTTVMSTEQTRIFNKFTPFGIRPFVSWNMPFGGSLQFCNSASSSFDTADFVARSPHDVDISTPPADQMSPVGPCLATSFMDAPSPLSSALIAQRSRQRTDLFLQGLFDDFMLTMNDQQKGIMANWLYQFWFFCFKTLKHWGRKHPPWNVETLEFCKYDNLRWPNSDFRPKKLFMLPTTQALAYNTPFELPAPPSLCKWSIHVKDDAFFALNEPDNGDLDTSMEAPKLITACLCEGLEQNVFSTAAEADLPTSPAQIATAAARSQRVLVGEALSFAIMAQNYEAVERILWQHDLDGYSSTVLLDVHALHIAATYLNGAKTCCNIFGLIAKFMSMLKGAHINDHGHTVLDNLMLTILRSHSATPLKRLDPSLQHEARHAGIEVDICGRWDADSPSFRSLISSGATTIPEMWKHKFCHSSIQAVSHSIRLLKLYEIGCGQPSGLFSRLCTSCGMKLQLMPLHTLVMTAFELGNRACRDEDLFGMIACYLALVAYGEDPLQEANMSLVAILDDETDNGGCTHRPMTPSDLILSFPEDVFRLWPQYLRTGWTLLQIICIRAEAARKDRKSLEDYLTHYHNFAAVQEQIDLGMYASGLHRCQLQECSFDGGESGPFGTDVVLGKLWASVQAELLNHRRLNDNDKWLSENFDMDEVLTNLQWNGGLVTGYTRKGLLKKHCNCAHFGKIPFPLREDVSTHYYSNMDNWQRSSFIQVPELSSY